MAGWHVGTTGRPDPGRDVLNWMSYASTVRYRDLRIDLSPPETLGDLTADDALIVVSMLRAPGPPDLPAWPDLELPLRLSEAKESGWPGDAPTTASLYRLRGHVEHGYDVEVWISFGSRKPGEKIRQGVQDALDGFSFPAWRS
jgi:hypothetical protein